MNHNDYSVEQLWKDLDKRISNILYIYECKVYA